MQKDNNINNSLEDSAEVIEQATKLKQEKNFSALIELTKAASEVWNENLLIAGMLGEAYKEIGDYDSAADVYSRLVSHDNIPYWIYVGYANVLEKQKDVSGTQKYFCHALEAEYSSELACRAAILIKYSTDPDILCTKLVSIIRDEFEDKKKRAAEFSAVADHLYRNQMWEYAAKLYGESIDLEQEVVKDHRRRVLAQIRCNDVQGARKSLERFSKEKKSKHSYARLEKVVDFCAEIYPYLRHLENIFIPQYYRRRYKLEKLSNDEAFKFFITSGIKNKQNPNPWFDHDYFVEKYAEYIKKGEMPIFAYVRLEHTGLVKASAVFDPVFYRQKYPDLKEMSVVLEHYVLHGHKEGRIPAKRRIPAAVIDEFQEMIDIEPKLLLASGGLNSVVRYPRVTPSLFVPGIVRKKYNNNIKAIVCVPFVSRGGADLVATYCVKALQNQYGTENVLLIVTDSSNVEVESWLEEETQCLVLEEETEFRDIDDKICTLHNVIGQYNPESVLNVNSFACWEMYKLYGRQLSTVTSLYAYYFCYDYDINKNRVGYITEYLTDTIDYMKGVMVDNLHIVEDIKDRYRFSENNLSKIHQIYSPYLDGNVSHKSDEIKDGILWIGRLSVQKRPDVLIKISQALPSIKFYVYGTPGDSEYSRSIIEEQYENIIYKGTFTDIIEIELEKYSMFLHNSEWEGIPTVLITMMANGVPIVTSDVGGVSELVSEKTGWLIDDCEDVAEYCRNISKVLLQPEVADRKVEQGIELVKQRHNWSTYVNALTTIGLLPELSQNIVKKEKECV